MPVDKQKDFARRCNTTIGYLRKAISKRQKIGTELSVCIEKESGGSVTRKMLHPDSYIKKWPELGKSKK